MGKNKKKPQQVANENMTNVAGQAQKQYEDVMSGPTSAESGAGAFASNAHDLANQANYRGMQDYGDIMSGYDDIPTNASYQHVTAGRPKELGEAYGYLRETVPGYRDFAETGGYSGQDIQELRARGVAPIRAAYGNTMMELDRARSLGGGGGSPNYIAAASKAQRELPGQMADSMTTVNAGLAEAIRKGKLEGLSGLGRTGGAMGEFASGEAGRQLTADTANQAADLQAQGMNQQARFGKLSGKASLYGSTPGMASMFGNQALQGYGLEGNLQQGRQRTGLDLLGAQMQVYGNQAQQPQATPAWKTALGVAGTVAPYVAQYYGARNAKNKSPIPMGAEDMGGVAQMSYGTTPYW